MNVNFCGLSLKSFGDSQKILEQDLEIVLQTLQNQNLPNLETERLNKQKLVKMTQEGCFCCKVFRSLLLYTVAIYPLTINQDKQLVEIGTIYKSKDHCKRVGDQTTSKDLIKMALVMSQQYGAKNCFAVIPAAMANTQYVQNFINMGFTSLNSDQDIDHVGLKEYLEQYQTCKDGENHDKGVWNLWFGGQKHQELIFYKSLVSGL